MVRSYVLYDAERHLFLLGNFSVPLVFLSRFLESIWHLVYPSFHLGHPSGFRLGIYPRITYTFRHKLSLFFHYFTRHSYYTPLCESTLVSLSFGYWMMMLCWDIHAVPTAHVVSKICRQLPLPQLCAWPVCGTAPPSTTILSPLRPHCSLIFE